MEGLLNIVGLTEDSTGCYNITYRQYNHISAFLYNISDHLTSMLDILLFISSYSQLYQAQSKCCVRCYATVVTEDSDSLHVIVAACRIKYGTTIDNYSS